MAITDLSFFNDAPPTEKELLKKLRHTRDGFIEERFLHNFLLDSYIGGGGFQNGLIPSPDAPFWGRRAYERGRSTWLTNREALLVPPQKNDPKPAQQSQLSYLVSFHGEDYDSYIDRMKCSAYHNPVEGVVRFTNALLFQQDAQREYLPPDIAGWITKADRRERHISHVGRNVALRGQIFGWGGTMLDLPQMKMNTLAENRSQGVAPYCIPLCPQEFLDWDMAPDGTILAVKIATMHEHPRASLLDMKLWEEHILFLYPDRWERYVILMPPADFYKGQPIPEDAGRILTERYQAGINPFDSVPVSFFAWDEGLGGVSSFGLPQIFNLAKVAWDLFQQNSELRRLMRDQTFATLVLPQPTQGGVKGNVAIGVGNFLSEPTTAKGLTRYISPSSGNAQIYEKRMEQTHEHFHTMAGVDSGTKKGGSETAEAMRIRYQKTEAMLQNAAVNLENWELPLLRLAGQAYGIRKQALDLMTVYRPKVFDVARFGTQINEAAQVLKLPWGKDVMSAIMKRTMRSALPNIGEKDLLAFDREIDQTVAENHDRVLEKLLGTTPSTTSPPPG